MALPVYVRRAHRIIATLWLLSVALVLVVLATGAEESIVINLPVVLILALAVTGFYLLARPWVQRFRAR